MTHKYECLTHIQDHTRLPHNWGVALYPAFDILDIAGPIDPLFLLSFSNQINLTIIAETLDPVPIQPAYSAPNPYNSHFAVSVNPTHTFANPPPDLDVLLVPGGGADGESNPASVVDFVRITYPKVQYLITICTGSGVAAQAGVLDGKRATTNKYAWAEVTPLGPNVKWTSPARWTVDGNIWTSSGVTSGLDLIFAFIETYFGTKHARELQGITEQKRTFDPCDDPFAAWYSITPVGNCRLGYPVKKAH